MVCAVQPQGSCDRVKTHEPNPSYIQIPAWQIANGVASDDDYRKTAPIWWPAPSDKEYGISTPIWRYVYWKKS